MADRLSLSQYSVPPLGPRETLALLEGLLRCRPRAAPQHVIDASAELRANAASLASCLASIEREGTASRPDVTRLVEVAWTALFWRLDTLAMLPASLYPRAVGAARLRDALFPGTVPLSFVKLPVPALLDALDERLGRIDRDALTPEIDDLAGREISREIARTRRLLHDGEEPFSPAAREVLREAHAAIAAYALAVMTMVTRRAPESLAVVVDALAPLKQAREAFASPQPPSLSAAPERDDDG